MFQKFVELKKDFSSKHFSDFSSETSFPKSRGRFRAKEQGGSKGGRKWEREKRTWLLLAARPARSVRFATMQRSSLNMTVHFMVARVHGKLRSMLRMECMLVPLCRSLRVGASLLQLLPSTRY